MHIHTYTYRTYRNVVVWVGPDGPYSLLGHMLGWARWVRCSTGCLGFGEMTTCWGQGSRGPAGGLRGKGVVGARRRGRVVGAARWHLQAQLLAPKVHSFWISRRLGSNSSEQTACGRSPHGLISHRGRRRKEKGHSVMKRWTQALCRRIFTSSVVATPAWLASKRWCIFIR